MQNAIKETLYLLAIAGMEESIVEGGEAPISECLDECEVIEQLKRESYADGYRDGSRKVIIDCYKKGIISLKQAAEDADMSEIAFAALAAQNKLV